MRVSLFLLVGLAYAGNAGCEGLATEVEQVEARSEAASPAADGEGAVASAAEDDELLSIGSKAPALDIANWYSGDAPEGPVTFESGNVYVVEFWATWCGPCVMSMPHLAELQKEYADKDVTIISVSDEDAETVNAFLELPVRGSKAEEPPTYGELTSAYRLTSDPDGSTSADYMEAAAQAGIPTAFLVGKTGLVEWIGHPMQMDRVLDAIVSDAWDRAAFAKEFREQQRLDKLQTDAIAALRSGDFAAARELAKDMAESTEDPAKKQLASRLLEFADQAESQQIMMTDPERAVGEFDKMLVRLDNDPRAVNQLAWGVYKMAASGAPLRNDLLQAAADATEGLLTDDDPQANLLDTISHLYHQMGELDQAIAYQERALTASQEADADAPQPEIEAFLEQLKAEKAGESSDDAEDDAAAGI
ncbi:Thiol-disulfide oxidoreductase ResA [Botrimarina colliarenosi]|uniref:Thiol-disulfide oxidoreductase ResA n=1 Tax=Botrimarina colliarenosi TaxID=2528001 RepID=A0A5C6ANV3_9BACT|nr:TlpA disulfide reductase family protein [Botrimarina colliarenosi]TWT99853.1 Thiol-disulfide oxidoreductase ResA [Botrimarina colliarenosi]